jgi:hypothetical protein
LHFERDVRVGLSEPEDCPRQQVAYGSDAESNAKTLKVSPKRLPREGLQGSGIGDQNPATIP